MSLRRMLPFLLLNIIVSAGVVLGILALWGQPRDCNCEPAAISSLLADPDLDPTAAALDALIGVATETPTPVAAATEAAEEEACDVTHTVQAGEALGVIAERYEVTIDDIVAATAGLDDPNLLFAGQLLVIPVCGITPTEVPTATAVPTVVVLESGNNAIQIADIANPGDLSVEQVLLINTGSDAIDLTGWTLSDGSELSYTFGQITLFGDGAGITVHSGLGEDQIPNLYWQRTTPVWQSAETASLRDAEGTVQATFTVP